MAAMPHLSARMGITTMRRMHVRRTVTTDLIGSWAACSSARDPGSTGSMDVGPFGVAVGLGAAGLDVVGLEAADLKVVDLPDEAGSTADVAALAADAATLAEEDSTAMSEADFMAEVDSMVEVAADSTVVAAMAAATGN